MLEPPLLLTFVISQVVGLAMVVCTVMAAVIDNDNTDVKTNEDPAEYTFVWHSVLMCFGMTYLLGISVLMFRVMPSVDKFHAKLVHAVVSCGSLAFTLAGFTLAVQMYNVHDSPHFHSVHGMLGLAAVTIFSAQWLTSVFAFLWPKAPQSIRTPWKSIHVCIGIGLILCSAFCSITGYNSHASKGKTKSSQQFYKAAGLLNVVFALLILYAITLRKYKRPPDTY